MPEEKLIRKILFCTDFSLNAHQAFQVAVNEVQRHVGSELYLLHVIPAPDAQYWKNYIYESGANVDEQAKEAFDKRIAEEYEAILPENVVMHKAFRIGKAAVEISRFAEEIQADMLVIGRQGRGALESLLFGSVAEKVVRRVNCPILVIPFKK